MKNINASLISVVLIGLLSQAGISYAVEIVKMPQAELASDMTTSSTTNPTSSAIPAPSFLTNWKIQVTGYDMAYGREQAASTSRIMPLVCPSRPTVECLQVEVESGDNLGMAGERAELTVMLDQYGNQIYENGASGTKYYALSVYIPSGWTPPSYTPQYGAWGTIFQLHGPDSLGVSPVFALKAQDKFYVNWRGGDMAVNTKNAQYTLSNSVIPFNQWVDFVVGITFSTASNGSITVWRHDQVKGSKSTTFYKVLSLNNLPTLQYSADPSTVGNHYWKTGYYRSVSQFTSRLYLGEEARGSSAASAAGAAYAGIPAFAMVNWNTIF